MSFFFFSFRSYRFVYSYFFLFFLVFFFQGADKTGRIDYAVHTSGARVIGIGNPAFTSATYLNPNTTVARKAARVLGLAVYHGPEELIKANSGIGSCWPFSGSQGRVSIQLAPFGQVIPKSISIEHVPSSIAQSVLSAPREAQIWGYQSQSDTEPMRLDKGDCSYEIRKSTIQFCNLKPEIENPINILQMRIMSNHGKEEYTCVYRLRVHGRLVR